MVAVAQYGCALEYASEVLKNDKEVVMAAVAEVGRALEYASDELKNDKDVKKAAMSLGLACLKCFSKLKPHTFGSDYIVTCDGCDEETNAEEKMMHCHKCDWGVCASCATGCLF